LKAARWKAMDTGAGKMKERPDKIQSAAGNLNK